MNGDSAGVLTTAKRGYRCAWLVFRIEDVGGHYKNEEGGIKAVILGGCI
jgi:hypothetical protein